MMYYWFKLFCLTLVLNNVVLRTSDFEFDHITLGYSGFLISWKKINAESLSHYFKFGYRIKDNQIDTKLNFSNFSEFIRVNPETPWLTQFKIHSLEENTIYEVIIESYSEKENLLGDPYSLDLRTNRKTNTKPAKPDFIYKDHLPSISGSTKYFHYFYKNIIWLPCGKERNCNGIEAGTHFAIKLRILDRRGEYKLEENKVESKEIRFLPGIFYEVSVISINNGFETESDPQEIFKIPACGLVTSVKMGPRINGSVEVSWKPPKCRDDFESFFQYAFIFADESFVRNSPAALYSFPNEKTNTSFEYVGHPTSYKWKVENLQPGDTYIFSIIGLSVERQNSGFPYEGKFTVPAENNN